MTGQKCPILWGKGGADTGAGPEPRRGGKWQSTVPIGLYTGNGGPGRGGNDVGEEVKGGPPVMLGEGPPGSGDAGCAPKMARGRGRDEPPL